MRWTWEAPRGSRRNLATTVNESAPVSSIIRWKSLSLLRDLVHRSRNTRQPIVGAGRTLRASGSGVRPPEKPARFPIDPGIWPSSHVCRGATRKSPIRAVPTREADWTSITRIARRGGLFDADAPDAGFSLPGRHDTLPHGGEKERTTGIDTSSGKVAERKESSRGPGQRGIANSNQVSRCSAD